MPMQKIILRPSVNVEATPLLNEGGWSYSQLIRFFMGMAQKIGGWTKFIQTQIVGTGRGSHAWADLLGNPYYAMGTEQRLQVIQAGELIDITPIESTEDITPDFSTTMGSPTVTVGDTGHGAAVGEWINIVIPISVGGLILHGFYIVLTVPTADTYTITAGSDAAATVNNGGAVPEFDTTNTSATVLVTLEDHGYSAGQTFTVEVSTTVGGLTLDGDYTIVTVPDA